MLFDAGLGRHLLPARVRRPGPDRTSTRRSSTRSSRATSTPCGCRSRRFRRVPPCILEFGTEEQKLRHLPAILKGEELWMQFLSEPSGGSDVAGALTTAVRDGDQWVLNGSKVWTSGRVVVGLGAVPRPDQLGRSRSIAA